MKNNKGFTLIELLVVISIIALLLSILMPSLSKVKEQGKSVVCRSNLHQWYICLMLYAADYDDTFWHGWGGGTSSISAPLNNEWMPAMLPYYDNIGDIRCCPTATATRDTIANGPNSGPGAGRNPFTAWGTSEFLEGDYGSYAPNGWLDNYDAKPPTMKAVWNSVVPGSPQMFWGKSARITHPGRVPFMTDAAYLDSWPLSLDLPPTTEFDDSYLSTSMMARVVQNRHGKGVQNAAFMDGVARRVGLKELWTLKWHRTYDTRDEYTLAGGSIRAWTPWMEDFTEY